MSAPPPSSHPPCLHVAPRIILSYACTKIVFEPFYITHVTHITAFQTFFLEYCRRISKPVHAPLGPANIKAYFQDTGLLGCFSAWQVKT